MAAQQALPLTSPYGADFYSLLHTPTGGTGMWAALLVNSAAAKRRCRLPNCGDADQMGLSENQTMQLTMNEPEYGPVFAVLTPQANTTVEPEMQLLLPGTVLTARSKSPASDARQRLLDYFDTLAETIARFDTAPIRACGFACTGSNYLVGREREELCFTELSAAGKFPVISATQSIRQALQVLSAKRLAMVSPYPAWLSNAAHAYWIEAGYSITATTSLPADLLDTRNIYKLNTARVTDLLADLPTDDCDVVLLSGTGMPTLSAIVGSAVKVPVLSSNLCLAWAMQAAVKPSLASRAALLDFLTGDAAWRKRLASRQAQP